jgi:hypothetical protein
VILVTLLAGALAAPVPNMKTEPLTADDCAALRAGVYDGELATESPNRDFNSVMVLPKAVAAVYRKNPTEARALLVKIADGGNPADSVKAVCYALDLRDGGGAGVPCALLFKTETWDKVDKDWKVTPREHWLAQLKEKEPKK